MFSRAWQALSHEANEREPSDIDRTLGTSSLELRSTKNASRAGPNASPDSVAALMLGFATRVFTPGAIAPGRGADTGVCEHQRRQCQQKPCGSEGVDKEGWGQQLTFCCTPKAPRRQPWGGRRKERAIGLAEPARWLRLMLVIGSSCTAFVRRKREAARRARGGRRRATTGDIAHPGA